MFNNPLNYGMAIPQIGAKKGLLSLSKINWGSLLSNTQKTLGIINQTIPIIYQIKPIISNAKTMFKIASTLKEEPQEKNINTTRKKEEETTSPTYTNIKENKPIFFL